MKRHVTLGIVGSRRSHCYSTDWQTGATGFPNILFFSLSFCLCLYLSLPLCPSRYLLSLQKDQCIQVFNNCRTTVELHDTFVSLWFPSSPFLPPPLLPFSLVDLIVTFSVLLPSIFPSFISPTSRLLCVGSFPGNRTSEDEGRIAE